MESHNQKKKRKESRSVVRVSMEGGETWRKTGSCLSREGSVQPKAFRNLCRGGKTRSVKSQPPTKERAKWRVLIQEFGVATVKKATSNEKRGLEKFAKACPREESAKEPGWKKQNSI